MVQVINKDFALKFCGRRGGGSLIKILSLAQKKPEPAHVAAKTRYVLGELLSFCFVRIKEMFHTSWFHYFSRLLCLTKT